MEMNLARPREFQNQQGAVLHTAPTDLPFPGKTSQISVQRLRLVNDPEYGLKKYPDDQAKEPDPWGRQSNPLGKVLFKWKRTEITYIYVLKNTTIVR